MRIEGAKHLNFIFLDIAALEAAHCLTLFLNQERVTRGLYIYYLQLGILLVFISFLVAFFTDDYRHILQRGYIKEVQAVCRHMAILIAWETICLFAFGLIEIFSRVVIFTTLFLGGIFMLSGRLLLKLYLKKKNQDIKSARTLMVIVDREQANILIQKLETPPVVFNIQGLAVADCDMTGEDICGINVSCSLDQALDYVGRHIIDEVLISLPGDGAREAELANRFLSIGLIVHIYTGQYFNNIPCIEYQQFNNITVASCFNRELSSWMIFCKRVIDIAGGLIGTILAIVIGMVIGPLIWLKSPGPVLFSQIRVGKNGRKFRIYKFRSMVMDAEQQKAKLLSQNKVKGHMFKIDHDPRIIPGIGRFIRQTSLDEFPQFFNVLKGEMSIVGTRPPTVDEYEAYSFWHNKRLAMKPGITGLWQISGRSDMSDFEEVVKLDSKYIDEWDIWMDIKIIFQTVIIVFLREGSV